MENEEENYTPVPPKSVGTYRLVPLSGGNETTAHWVSKIIEEAQAPLLAKITELETQVAELREQLEHYESPPELPIIQPGETWEFKVKTPGPCLICGSGFFNDLGNWNQIDGEWNHDCGRV